MRRPPRSTRTDTRFPYTTLFRSAGPGLTRMRAGFQEDALSYLLVLRLIPLFPFWLVNLVPAFLGVSLKVFALGTLIGIIPGSLVYASVGNEIGRAHV